MTLTATVPTLRDVDAAVASVLADLFTPARGVPAQRRNSTAQSDEPVFAGRLLSLREAEGITTAARVIRIAPGTVVTPLAKDYLKSLGLEVRFVAQSEVAGARNVGEWGFSIEAQSGLLDGFRRSILDAGTPWRELGASVADAAGWVAESERRGALVLCDEAARAIYEAYQVPHVRAAVADEPNSAARAVRSIGVNLLVVEPAGKSIALLKQIGASFRRAGGPMVPDWASRANGGSRR